MKLRRNFPGRFTVRRKEKFLITRNTRERGKREEREGQERKETELAKEELLSTGEASQEANFFVQQRQQIFVSFEFVFI